MAGLPSGNKLLREEVDEYYEQYIYRSRVIPGLSYQEYAQEPYEIVTMNLLFYAIGKQKERQELDKLDRKK